MPRTKIRFQHNLKALEKLAVSMGRVTIPLAYEDSAEDIADIMTNLGRKYIPAKHRLAPGQKSKKTSTGRLWSSWGEGDIETDNPDFKKNDQVRIIRKRTGRTARIQVIIGTKVPYAKAVNDGRPKSQGRTAYGFAEKAAKESAELAKNALEERIGPLLETGSAKTRAKRQFNSAKQKRTLLGRF